MKKPPNRKGIIINIVEPLFPYLAAIELVAPMNTKYDVEIEMKTRNGKGVFFLEKSHGGCYC